MIDFELTPLMKMAKEFLHNYAKDVMRPISRQYDENEHTEPTEFIQKTYEMFKSLGFGFSTTKVSGEDEAKSEIKKEKTDKPKIEMNLLGVMALEELAWGCPALTLRIPGPGLGGAAIMAAGTPEQKKRFMKILNGPKPSYGAMALTEPGFGSDASAVGTTAVKDGDYYILNGTKIFVTGGEMAELYVVWATLGKELGRSGIKAFVVEKGTPGLKMARLENKLGLRASDTAEIVLDDCRVHKDNLLGGEKKEEKGFKGAMQTFDATRPIVAAMAVGIARAAYDYIYEDLVTKDGLEINYGRSIHKRGYVETLLEDMEAKLEAARLLTWKAAWMLDKGEPNLKEASMAKAKAGAVVDEITQKAIELYGPEGYSRRHMLEKWMRDAKVYDVFEGTGQVQRLVIARAILNYTRKELR
ncbi:MAG: acyl-CoA dehydrogenase family protein [Deltaproteobacteria bacterium]|nr:acyl-CoA dehydrogenase family protein [Deltaproteobacteria bacterium]MCL5791498.1 acyl-CoA dehydrogenase family protein [Deltaproteobacteria bacterium]